MLGKNCIGQACVRLIAASIGVLFSVAARGNAAVTSNGVATSGSADAMRSFVLSRELDASVGKASQITDHDDEMRGFALSTPASAVVAERPSDASSPRGSAGQMRGFVLSPSSAVAVREYTNRIGRSEQSVRNAQDGDDDKMRGFALSSPASTEKVDGSDNSMHGFVLTPPDRAAAKSPGRRGDGGAVKSPAASLPAMAQTRLSHPRVRITFANGARVLSGDARKILDAVAQTLLSSKGRSYVFGVEGHANAVGQAPLNQRISEQRAAAAVHYLITVKGVPAERLAFSVGKGVSSPVDPNPVSPINRCAVITLKKG